MRTFLTLSTLGLLVVGSATFGLAAPLTKATLKPAVIAPSATPKVAPSPKATGTPAKATPSPKPTKAPHYIYVQFEATTAGVATGLDKKKTPSDVVEKWESLTSHPATATENSGLPSGKKRTHATIVLERPASLGKGESTVPGTEFREIRITDTTSSVDGKHKVSEVWVLKNAVVVSHMKQGTKPESLTLDYQSITDTQSTGSTTVDDSWNANV